ncbi:MAG: DUF2855 family protein [Caldimonas sp.]
MTTTFTVGRDDLRRTQWVESSDPPLAPGQLRLGVDLFALTSNNVTYGAFGEAMNYWDFFPTGDAATGCIPVWGFATVRESRVAGIEPGERFYGYLPMADSVVLEPVRVDAAGFFDGAAHRRELHRVYNQYLRCGTDPLYRAGHEALIALLRPLFMTSFLIDDFLADNAFFGTRSVLVSSASSKTAYGLAFCLAARRGEPGATATVGLTSPGNVDFTRRLGCYGQIVAYADVTTLANDEPAVYVDMSGNAALRSTIHAHWNDRLAYSCSVGGTHWEELGSGKGLAGPRPVLFFAPAQVKKRVGDWGAAGLQQRLASAWAKFIHRVDDPHDPWLRVVSGQGRAAVQDTYVALLDGHVPADEGRILRV